MTPDTVFRQHPNQVSAEADGEVLMMHIDSGTYYGLNEVASFIWSQLAEPRRFDELAMAIEAEFEVDPARCQEDACFFLKSMVEDGLVEVVSTGAP